MKDLTSILVVVDRSARDTRLLTKALVLARELNARIELFSCDSQHAYAPQNADGRGGIGPARQNSIADGYDYLRRLSHLVTAQNVSVSIEVVCESPLYEGIVHKVFKSCPDLVMKAAASKGSAGRAALDSNDWQLVRICPVPLMLSRGATWSSRPHFVAAVEVSEEETPGLRERILRSAAYLSAGCRGELDLVISEHRDDDAPTGKADAAKLRKLSQELHLGADRVWTLARDPTATLPTFAATQHPDVLVLGAPTHQAHATERVGTLTRHWMDTLNCDFLLLRPRRFEFPVPGPLTEAWAGEPRGDSYSPDPRSDHLAHG
jgi:universal stress protein E